MSQGQVLVASVSRGADLVSALTSEELPSVSALALVLVSWAAGFLNLGLESAGLGLCHGLEGADIDCNIDSCSV